MAARKNVTKNVRSLNERRRRMVPHVGIDLPSAPESCGPVYDGPYRVLERSTHFFLLEMGDRTDKVSTLRLKAA
jgi:hypothetical protein